MENFRIENLRITNHVLKRIQDRQFTMALLVAAVEHPDYSYDSKKFPGQVRLVKGDICVTVDTIRKSIPTAFYNGRLDPNWKK